MSDALIYSKNWEEKLLVRRDHKHVYVVLSGTDTVLGRIIQKKLGVSYNHCSISLDEDLERIYSFGRKTYWHVFSSGFVKESKSSGFYKRFGSTRIIVLKIPVTKKQWTRIKRRIATFKAEQDLYRYSLIGLIYCDLGIDIKRKNKYFCSQFVTEVLNSSGLNLFDRPETLIRPHDYLNLTEPKIIYCGQIRNYERKEILEHNFMKQPLAQ